MDDIIEAIDEALPRFNRHLLVDYPRQQVNSTTEFLSTTFAEAMKMLRGAVTYQGYRVMSPEERVEFEVKRGVPIANSELQLIAYDFVYDGRTYTTHLYMPYMVEGQIIIKDTRHAIMLGITEKIFSRTSNGVTVRVTRLPLQFFRDTQFFLESLVTGQSSTEFVVTTKLHHRARASRRRDANTTVIHYLLCRFGFTGLLRRFGLTDKDMIFTDKVGDDVEAYDYFHAKKQGPKNDPVYLKVRRTILEDATFRKLTANILYTLTKWGRHTVSDLYDPSNSVYLVMLGEILYGSVGESAAHGQASTHMFSTDSFLDPKTQHRLRVFGVEVSDIYDLLQYIFVELDRIMVHTVHQDLYNKRIDIIDLFMIKTFVQLIYHQVYNLDQNPNRLGDQEMARFMRIRPDAIRRIASNRDCPNASMVGTSIFNNNGLLSFMNNKIRLGGPATGQISLQSPDVRFHPSIPAVETLIGFSGQNPGVTGTINVFLEITPEGGIVRPDYADEIDSISKFLPFR